MIDAKRPWLEQVAHYRDVFGRRGVFYSLLARWRPARYSARVRPRGALHTVRVRLGSSDLRVLRNIFYRKVYRVDFTTGPEFIVDAGGNGGFSSVYFANRYPGARVMAIEPFPDNFALLAENTRPYPNIIPVNAALWSFDGPLIIGAPRGSEFGTLPVRAGHVPGGIPVQGRTLPSLLKQHRFPRIDYLKMDIEGAEAEVFADPSDWIDRLGFIYIEEHERNLPGSFDPYRRAVAGFEYHAARFMYRVAARRRDLLKSPPRNFEPCRADDRRVWKAGPDRYGRRTEPAGVPAH